MKKKKTPILLIAFIAILALFAWRNQSYQNFLADFDHTTAAKKGLPVFLELGRRTCQPCMAMKPVLKSLKKKYSKIFAVSYIDVYKDSQTAEKFKVTATPTLIFIDSQGNQLHRQTGYMSEQQIIKKWTELGISAASK